MWQMRNVRGTRRPALCLNLILDFIPIPHPVRSVHGNGGHDREL